MPVEYANSYGCDSSLAVEEQIRSDTSCLSLQCQASPSETTVDLRFCTMVGYDHPGVIEPYRVEPDWVWEDMLAQLDAYIANQ